MAAPHHETTPHPSALSRRPLRATIGVIFIFAAASGLVGAPASGHAEKLTEPQVAAVAAYEKSLAAFKNVLAVRRAQIKAGKKLPGLPGQAIYFARVAVMSTYKDLTDALPSRIGEPNRFGVPSAYFDVDIEPLVVEYGDLFDIMQAPPRFAQSSETPFKDVVDLGRAVARAKGLDEATAEAAGRIALGIFFAETNGTQNIGNARSNQYKGSFQTNASEDRSGRRKWAALKSRIAEFDPAVAARDEKEDARARSIDQRYNHWTAVRNGLMNAHADIFPQIPEIARTLPNEIDQMKLFQLIQLIPTPTRAAIQSSDVATYTVDEPRIMGYLRNNSIFTFGKTDRSKSSATYREILDAMWLYTRIFEKAQAKYEEIKAETAK